MIFSKLPWDKEITDAMAGLYIISPFNVAPNGDFTFKIGKGTKLYKRIESYNTYYPHSFWVVAVLPIVKPRVPKAEGKSDKEKDIFLSTFLNAPEKQLMDALRQHGFRQYTNVEMKPTHLQGEWFKGKYAELLPALDAYINSHHPTWKFTKKIRTYQVPTEHAYRNHAYLKYYLNDLRLRRGG